MARTEARAKTAIWTDPEFTAMSAAAQRVYWLLFSQPTISLCGVVAYTPKRWAAMASNTTVADIDTALAELEAHRYVVVDVDTEEVLVRSFLRNDGVWRTPKTRDLALALIETVTSPRVRRALDDEIARLRSEQTKPLVDRVSDRVSDRVPDRVPDTLRGRARADSVSVSVSVSDKNKHTRALRSVSAHEPEHPTVASLTAGRQRSQTTTAPYEADFDAAWASYPRRIARKAALRAYTARRKTGATAEELHTAVEHFAAAMRGRNPEHILHGSTFFGPDERWRDYLQPPPTQPPPAAIIEPPDIGPWARRSRPHPTTRTAQ
jgi:hypothetical protein